MVKAEKEKENSEKEKEAFESQFAILESEKTSLTKALEEAKAARDEAITTADSLNSEKERLVRVAKKEVEEKVVRAISERDKVIKALEAKKVD